jgi:D-amino peptidase
MRKLLISCDMEGCAAVASQHALWPDRWEWNAARRWMSEVIVVDSHGNAHNIDPDLLPDNIQLVRSWPRPLLQMQGVEDPEVAACAFVGYHAGSTSNGGILAHSFSGAAFRRVSLNDQSCSEGYLNAALAGEFRRPVVFISGDQHTIDDARRYAPEATGCITKQAIGWRSQMSLPPAQVRRQLAEAAARAFAQPLPQPFIVRGPFRLELDMVSHVAAEMLTYLPGVERLEGCKVVANFARLDAVMRFISFAMLYSPTGNVAL